MSNNAYKWKSAKLDKLIHMPNRSEPPHLEQNHQTSQPKDKLIGEMIQAINSGTHTRPLLEELLKTIAETFQVERATIYQQQQENLEIYQQWRQTSPESGLVNIHTPESDSQLEWQDQTITPDLDGFLVNSMFSKPIFIGSKLFGRLTLLTDREPITISASENNLLEQVAHVLGIAIEKNQLYQEIQALSAFNEQLSQEKQQMEQANEAQEEFFSHMTHDLRSPLAAILGFSRMLKDQMFGELNNKQMQYVSCIFDSGQHMLELVNNLLDLSKIDANREELFLEKIAVEEVCKASMCIVEERAKEQNINLKLKINPKINFCQADKLRLKQILVNLLTNGIKFTEKGSVTLEVQQKVDTIEFAVIDTGVGIKPSDQDKLFQPFNQLKNPLNRKHKGTGLGLTLCRKLARLHGGDITLKSLEGQGSCFTLKIPREPLKNDKT